MMTVAATDVASCVNAFEERLKLKVHRNSMPSVKGMSYPIVMPVLTDH